MYSNTILYLCAYRMRLGLFDPANYTSYHTLSPADVNTNKSQVKVT